VTVGVVGGSDLVKITEQLGKSGREHATRRHAPSQVPCFFLCMSNNGIGCFSAVLTDYDYVFSENGLVAHKNGELIRTQVSLLPAHLRILS
jgi:phosphomannomutase